MPVGPGPKKRDTNRLSQRRDAKAQREPSDMGTPNAKSARVASSDRRDGCSQSRSFTAMTKHVVLRKDRATLPRTIAAPPQPVAASPTHTTLYATSPAA